MKEWKDKEKEEAKKKAVFPCVLKILPDCIFNRCDPIVVGVKIEKGVLYKGTPICVKSLKESNSDEFLLLGVVDTIKKNGKDVDMVRNDEVSIRIVSKGTNYL